jgi:hypothetical protein
MMIPESKGRKIRRKLAGKRIFDLLTRGII